MDKKDIFNQALDFAQAVINDIGNNKIPSLDPWAEWNDALLRYVYDHEPERTRGQYLENLVRQSYGVQDMSVVSANAQKYISEMQSMPYEDGRIAYEPPFDVVWPNLNYPPNEPEGGNVQEHWSENTRPH
jgi:hypothetical protein